MRQFNLEEWLKDKSRKVVTREGKDVEIIHTNSPVTHHPIVGFIDKSIYTWTIDGKLIYGKEEQDKNDLFFADEEETPSTLLTELKSYLSNTPREQIEKDWKEIQDWYNQHVTNKSNEKEESTEFDKCLLSAFYSVAGKAVMTTGPASFQEDVDEWSKPLLDLARKELMSEISDFEIYDKGFKEGKKYALKDLLK